MISLKDQLAKKIANIKSAGELVYVDRQRTLIPALDIILGGGLPKGRVVQIWGPESVGKSALCLNIIKGLQILDPTAGAIYIDAELTVTKDDIEVHDLDPSRLVFYEPYGGEDAIDTALTALSNGVKIAVVDSVPYLRPVKVLESIEKDAAYRDISSIALLMERVQSKIVTTLQRTQGILIFINQQRPAKDMYKPPSYPGGTALSFMLSCSIQISSASKDKEDPNIITQNVLIRKNKAFTPMLKGTITLENRLVKRGQNLAECAALHKIITKKGGGHFEIDKDMATRFGLEPKLGQGATKVGLVLEQNPKFFNYLYDELLTKACTREQIASLVVEEEGSGSFDQEPLEVD